MQVSLNVSGLVALPPGVVTVMLTVPQNSGAVTSISVLESEMTEPSPSLPKLTLVAPDRFVP